MHARTERLFQLVRRRGAFVGPGALLFAREVQCEIGLKGTGRNTRPIIVDQVQLTRITRKRKDGEEHLPIPPSHVGRRTHSGCPLGNPSQWWGSQAQHIRRRSFPLETCRRFHLGSPGGILPPAPRAFLTRRDNECSTCSVFSSTMSMRCPIAVQASATPDVVGRRPPPFLLAQTAHCKVEEIVALRSRTLQGNPVE